ncbi:LysR family transcriptional regulator [Vibrio gazogenes]|uniref:DNA-binding transcriptional regulator, LysR family n=1 Tax=Vibrio gazogenes DSM 21264 = NBRC 103151 TaxID=1123492 RepID=A0A1M4TJS1_VIBGA|nr:LysR family transcriptional regulator [Vibrio gazogenes]USP16115.1 LysR family transcriptional regulator [Vibrio gazogenes]SHE44721.1 DNA-binding transcriptional regulator, LysR family [Vibrio gazogenes DSM 21264] [Vibrio gazogenes DSM 21264 = NBRC 103151]SJN54187.1 HTH-type transcriptional regulator DmlR [Vibrio gazogenes]
MLEAMEQFVKVIELGSFSAAASVLGKTPSTLTRRLDQLEHELGVKLLVRSTRHLELTPDGEQFYSQCQGIVSAVGQVKESFRKPREVVEGMLQITTFDTFGREMLAPLLPEFRQRYPDVRIGLSLENRMEDLYESNADLAVRYGRPEDSNLIYRPLLDMSAVLVAGPDYLAKHPPLTSPEDLRQHPCLAFLRPRQFTWWYFKKGNETRKVRIDPVLASKGGAPLLIWARENQGITIVSRVFAEHDLKAGRLVELLPSWQPSLTEQGDAMIYLTWKASSAKRPVVRAMVDFLVERVS